MPQFRYTIHTPSGQVISDTTIADSERAARYELENLGNTVLSIGPVTTDQKKKRVFAFEGTDASGKDVSGKIKTADEATAREKLEKGHGLANVSLTEVKTAAELTVAERQAILQEAQGVLVKASTMFASVQKNDPRRTKIAAIRQQLDALVANNDAETLRTETPNLLSELQEIERAMVIELEVGNKDEVIFGTEQLIEQVKREAEDLKKDTRFLALNTILSEALILSRWLLVFYAAYFAFAELVVAKRLNVPLSDFLASSLSSPLLYKVTLAVIVIYVFARLKLSLLESTFFSALLLSGMTGLLIVSLFMI